MEPYDVLVVGAGAAGVAAAIEAGRRGARVGLIDDAAEPGGTAAVSGGGVLVAGSAIQAREGIDDNPQLALEDWIAWGGESVDVAWANRYVEASVAEVYDWLGNLGVRWTHVQPQEGNRVPRWHAPAGGGEAMMETLVNAAQADPKIAWHPETRLISIDLSGGRVAGIEAATPSGSIVLHAPVVIIATGGFNNSLALVRRYAPNLPERVLLGGGVGARGDGQTILEAAGAELVNLDAIWTYPYATPDYLDPTGERGLVVRRLEGEIWVNHAGQRFHNEDRRGGGTGAPALLAQPGATCWSVIDTSIAAGYIISDPRYRHGNTTHRDRLWTLLEESPFVARGETLEALADAAGLDRQAFIETVECHNGQLALGLDEDPAFGRRLRGLRPIAEGPFYAIQFFPLVRKNLGGVRTDLAGRVLRPSGDAIEGLLAAGEVAGMAGGRINGRAALEGTALGPSLYSGRIAGRTAVS
ncbi:MAG: FAD-dependent oxidoreductase [Dehalococcoidia bacterium]